MGVSIYSISWMEPKDIPMFQTMIYSMFQWGRILSSAVFALAMKSSFAQLAFFVAIGAISLLSSFLYSCTSAPTVVLPEQQKSPSSIIPEDAPGCHYELAQTLTLPQVLTRMFVGHWHGVEGHSEFCL